MTGTYINKDILIEFPKKKKKKKKKKLFPLAPVAKFVR